MNWQPIETAPKNGRPILLYSPEHGGQYAPVEEFDRDYYIFTGWWYGAGWHCCEYDRHAYSPTHWMPLPEPPSCKSGCRARLAPGMHWAFCGETDMGQTVPALCTECGGQYRRDDAVR